MDIEDKIDGLFAWTILSIVVIFIIFCGKAAYETEKREQYCGIIVKTYMTNAGYKVQPTRHVVFYNNKLKRNIDVQVNNQTFVNVVEQQNVCFNLNKHQLNE